MVDSWLNKDIVMALFQIILLVRKSLFYYNALLVYFIMMPFINFLDIFVLFLIRIYLQLE